MRLVPLPFHPFYAFFSHLFTLYPRCCDLSFQVRSKGRGIALLPLALCVSFDRKINCDIIPPVFILIARRFRGDSFLPFVSASRDNLRPRPPHEKFLRVKPSDVNRTAGKMLESKVASREILLFYETTLFRFVTTCIRFVCLLKSWNQSCCGAFRVHWL